MSYKISPRGKLALCALQKTPPYRGQEKKFEQRLEIIKRRIIDDLDRKVFYPIFIELKEWWIDEKTRKNPTGLVELKKSNFSIKLVVGNKSVIFGFIDTGFYFGSGEVPNLGSGYHHDMAEIDGVIDDDFESKIIELLLP